MMPSPNNQGLPSKRFFWAALPVVVAAATLMATPASAALVPLDELPSTQLVQQSPAELQAAGCSQLPPVTSAGYVDVPPGKPLQVAPFVDQTQRWMCPATSAASFTPAQGEVRGLRDAAICAGVGAIGGPGFGSGLLQGICSAIYNSSAEYVSDRVWSIVIGVLLLPATVAGSLAAWVLQIVSIVLGIVLAKGDFVSDPFVRTGWPFVQGVVNIGFVFILLFIAFATTIGYEAANARRTLPRLLIAVVLVNFSLIIGGLIIDISRVMTALFLGAVGYNPHAVGAGLLRATDLISGVWGLQSGNANVLWLGLTVDTTSVTQGTGDHVSRAARLIMTTWAANMMIVGYTIAVVFLTVFFFIRRVMLLLLLIVSPIAYLTWVLPNTQSIASRWWSEFIKWAMFGPAAAFLLALIVNLGTQADFLGTAGDGQLDFINNFVRISILGVMLFITAMIGQYVGGVAGNLSVSMGKRANRMLYRYTGTQAALGYARNQAGDAADTIRSRWRDFRKGTRGLGWTVAARRDAQGKLLPGESSLASWATGKIAYTGKKRKQYDAVRNLGAINDGNVYNKAVAPGQLSKKHVTEALTAGHKDSKTLAPNIRNIIDLGSMAQLKDLMNNDDFMADLSDEQRNEFTISVANKQAFSAGSATNPIKARIDATGAYVADEDESATDRNIARAVDRLTDKFGRLDDKK